MKNTVIVSRTSLVACTSFVVVLSALSLNAQTLHQKKLVRVAQSSKTTVSASGIQRKSLLSATIDGQKTISRVEVTEIRFPAHQKAPRHLHSCPVVGRVTAGEILFQIEGQPAKVLKVGESFYEPANATILHFDNNTDKPASFTAYYLVGADDHELTTILPPAQK